MKKKKIKIQTLNLKNVQKLQKIIRVKNQYLQMDLTSQNSKNKMHLAWKLVLTHLYTPDAVIIIYMTFRWYCRMILQKNWGNVWLNRSVKKETEIKTMDVSCSPVLHCWALLLGKLSWSSYTNIIVMISYKRVSKKTTSKRFTGEKGGKGWGTTEPTWELRLDMCWLKPFFFIPYQLTKRRGWH